MMLAQLDAWLSTPIDGSLGAGFRASSDDRDFGSSSPDANAHTRQSRVSHVRDVSNDHDRVASLRHGDVTVFEQLFFEHATPLRRFVRAMVHSPDLAQDIVQDVFSQLWERRETIEVKATLRAYLYAAARGRALTVLRAAGVREAYAAQTITDDVLVIPAQAPDVLARIERDELTRALGEALATLPPRVRQAAELRWFVKLSHAEIAAVMGTAAPTVNNQLTTALRTLRERLRPYLGD